MSYRVYFEAKLEGVDKWVNVGDNWIIIPSGCASLIREVCDTYPISWDGKMCSDMYAVLLHGVSLLSLYPEKYKSLEGMGSWCSVSSTRDLLRHIADACGEFPTAIIRVDT